MLNQYKKAKCYLTLAMSSVALVTSVTYTCHVTFFILAFGVLVTFYLGTSRDFWKCNNAYRSNTISRKYA